MVGWYVPEVSATPARSPYSAEVRHHGCNILHPQTGRPWLPSPLQTDTYTGGGNVYTPHIPEAIKENHCSISGVGTAYGPPTASPALVACFGRSLESVS